MPISPSDIQFRLSGGAANAAPAASLGGVKSSVASPAGLFDDVTAAQSSAGSVEYRCAYVHNAHATLTLENAVAWISANTPNVGTVVEIGIGTAALNATEQTVASESTAPAGVTFAVAANKAAGIALGSIPPGQGRSVWARRTVTAGASAGADTATIKVEGETA